MISLKDVIAKLLHYSCAGSGLGFACSMPLRPSGVTMTKFNQVVVWATEGIPPLLRQGIGVSGRRSRAGISLLVGSLTLLFVCGFVHGAEQSTASQEYELKAVFIFNLTQFVEWPPQTFSDPRSPLVVGILGHDPFGPILDDVIGGEHAGGHPLVARRYAQLDDIDTCHLLYVSRSESARLETIAAFAESRGILTVSEGEGFARRGAMIRLVTTNNKIRLKINLPAAQAAGLTISSKLLRPAGIVAHQED